MASSTTVYPWSFLLYTYGKFGASYDLNYTGSWPVVNATPGSSANRFRDSR